MKLNFSAEALRASLNGFAAALPKSSSNSISALSGLHVAALDDQVTFVATNGDHQITTIVPVGDGQPVTSVTEPGSALLVGQQTLAFLAALSGASELVTDDDGAQLRCDGREYVAAIVNDDPVHMAAAEGDSVTVNAAELIAAATGAAKFADSDETRPVLTGVFVTSHERGVACVGTDSHVLCETIATGLTALGESSVIIPAAAVALITKSFSVEGDIEVTIASTGGESPRKDATLSQGNVTVTTRLIAGEYPAYQRVFEANAPTATLTVDRAVLLDTLNAALVGIGDASQLVTLEVSSDRIVAKAKNVYLDGENTAECAGQYDGDLITIGFSSKKLRAALAAAPTDQVLIGLSDATHAAVVTSPEDDTWTAVVMPIRLG